ncbi:hypothetical protein EDEG_02902 [Edhazardia aedis USNM 41457]|uniref:Uncharacterized protein n=1 Tax=Edhazardia aedis (strain USNM 41457) TaxID=1003232 RepID=J8ZSS5_EDHAE|nr:hypothetical protein EDEG_02902 [Edhazardia aedis USNM 41457]|eukprot:EJW02718.1 hypothetical protein EDEG_02902 [Edhazardia aedis USNM 41457]
MNNTQHKKGSAVVDFRLQSWEATGLGKITVKRLTIYFGIVYGRPTYGFTPNKFASWLQAHGFSFILFVLHLKLVSSEGVDSHLNLYGNMSIKKNSTFTNPNMVKIV